MSFMNLLFSCESPNSAAAHTLVDASDLADFEPQSIFFCASTAAMRGAAAGVAALAELSGSLQMRDRPKDGEYQTRYININKT